MTRSITDLRRLPVSTLDAMSYGALLGSLRAVEEADLDADTLGRVATRLRDAAEVASSGLGPVRLWSALRHSGAQLFVPELDAALQHAVADVAALPGRSLVLLDTSGSMLEPLHGHTGVPAIEVGAVAAATLADAARRGGGSADVVAYATDSARQPIDASVARSVDAIAAGVGALGHGADACGAARRWFDGHDRVLVLTDRIDRIDRIDRAEQPAVVPDPVDRLPCPVAVFELRGDGPADLDVTRRRYRFPAFTDAAFDVIARLDRRRAAA